MKLSTHQSLLEWVIKLEKIESAKRQTECAYNWTKDLILKKILSLSDLDKLIIKRDLNKFIKDCEDGWVSKVKNIWTETLQEIYWSKLATEIFTLENSNLSSDILYEKYKKMTRSLLYDFGYDLVYIDESDGNEYYIKVPSVSIKK